MRPMEYALPDLKQEQNNLGWGVLPERQPKEVGIETWLKNLSPSDLVAVHVTNTFPSDGVMRTHVGWAEHMGKKGAPRDTLHFTLNTTVQESHGMKVLTKSEWVSRNFVVLSPLAGFPKEQILNMKTDDTFLLGDVVIPPETHILVDRHRADILRDQNILSQEEFLNITHTLYGEALAEIPDEYAFEKDGIVYVVCDLSENIFRARIDVEIEKMGFRVMPMGEHGWDDALRRSGIRERFDLPEMILHDNHIVGSVENLGNRVGNIPYSTTDTFIFKIKMDLSEYGEKSMFFEIDKYIRSFEGDLQGCERQIQNISDKFLRSKNFLKKKYRLSLERLHTRLLDLETDPEFSGYELTREKLQQLARRVQERLAGLSF